MPSLDFVIDLIESLKENDEKYGLIVLTEWQKSDNINSDLHISSDSKEQALEIISSFMRASILSVQNKKSKKTNIEYIDNLLEIITKQGINFIFSIIDDNNECKLSFNLKNKKIKTSATEIIEALYEEVDNDQSLGSEE